MKEKISIICCMFFIIVFSACNVKDDSTIETNLHSESEISESVLLLSDRQNDIEIYGITENNTERIQILYEYETIEINASFSNFYEEIPHVSVQDIDNDSVNEIILSIRRETGTKRTYDFYICNKEDEWKVVTYNRLSEDVSANIAYQYDTVNNALVFTEGNGNQFEAVLPDWSDEYPYAGEVSFADNYSYDVSAMTVEVIPEIKMTDSLPYKPLSIIFDLIYKDGEITLEFSRFCLLESEITEVDTQTDHSLMNPYITSITDNADIW